MVIDPAAVRDALAEAKAESQDGITIHSQTWCKAEGGIARTPEERSYLQLQIHKSGGILTLRIEKAQLPNLADLLPPEVGA